MQSPDLTLVMAVPRLPPRPREGHKGTFGRVLVVAGSPGMSGAAVLCGSSALRGGAGLVFVAVPESIGPVVATGNPCYLTIPLPDDPEARAQAVRREWQASSVLVMGPGLGQSEVVRKTLATLLDSPPEVPLVLDADALNCCATVPGALAGFFPAVGFTTPTVITPHPGEFARLLGCEIADVQSNRQEFAVRFAREHHLVVVLKGAGTVVTDGRRVYTNTTGNPGMGTGGTGDVLTGLIGALVAQKQEAFEAAVLGTYLHGLAGDLAANKLGEVSLIASDLIEWLPAAFGNHA